MGPYTHEELVRMDARFRTRLLRAFERGKESRQAAANQIAAGVGCGFLARRFLVCFSSVRSSGLRTNSVHSCPASHVVRAR